MRTKNLLSLLIFALLAMPAFPQAWRGNGRLQGVVLDSAGAPIKGAKVVLRMQRGGSGGPDVTTDDKGKWAVLGLASGAWNIDFEAPGFATKKVSMEFRETERVPPMKVNLDKEAAPEPAPAAATTSEAAPEVKIGGTAVSPEIAAEVERGNDFLGQKKFTEAITEYEKAYPSLSSNLALKQALARAYYGAGQLKKAIVLLDEYYKADPSNVQNAVLLANLLLEDGQLDKGKAVLDNLPAGTQADPNALANIGILLLNKKQPSLAFTYFNKAISGDATRADFYYYRGLSMIQMGKVKEARGDLEKTVSLAPDSQEAKDAKELLRSIK